MRSGVIHVLLVLLIRRDGGGAVSVDEFRPTPIPLNEWREVRGGREAGPAAAAAPAGRARYWEDALRHSVYLTLVRDKIDQLIVKGIYEDASSEIDERDLWDKVKRAPFDRIETEEPTMVGDAVVMAKGKLMKERHSFRFVEDKLQDKCTHDKCMDGVKALWSVKRERQRDAETFPGQYHYDLTFSVVSQRKHKPYEKPARTFTVRESVPEKVIETPQENRYYKVAPVPTQTPRNERGIWFHKNIAPNSWNQGRQHHNSLDRLFSSLFSDDDEELPHPRYKTKQYIPQVYQQYSKVGHVGAPSEHQQKKLNPYGHKPQSYKYSRPIPPPPQSHVHHHYLDVDAIGVVSNPYIQEYRHGPLHKHSKTQRPPVLPTPPNPILLQKNFSIETTTKLKPDVTEETTLQPPQPENVTPHRTYNKHKPTTVKISYASEHVRPPVYNAPPGVFVTMDKKPFKPMPPLRLVHSSKHHKPSRPTDFRPSPQVLDIQFSEPDPLFDSAFRPITVNYANVNTTEKAVAASSDKHFRKSNTTVKKPPKKHEIIKALNVTTPAPEIITAHSDEDSDAEWTNVLGTSAETTPMAAHKEKTGPPETTTPITTSTSKSTTTTTTTIAPHKKRITTTTTTEAPITTPKPTKRTRPPPKFKRPEKVKKHKRVTTTTTTTTTTEAPRQLRKQDLTPQASSASASAVELPLSQPASASATPTTTPTPAAAAPAHTTTTITTTTTTTQPTTTTPVTQPTTTQSLHVKQNRYRQSTLKYRSTSGKDKKDDKPRTILPPTGNFPPRRKGSKFQGHVQSSTPKNTDKQYDEEGREDHIVSPYKSKHISTTESLTPERDPATEKTTTTTATYEEVADNIYITSGSPDYSQEEESDVATNDASGEEQESRDHSEFVPSTAAMTPSERTNEITETDDDTSEVTEVIVTTTPKNKSKCKKKKHNNLSNTTDLIKPETTESLNTESETTTTTPITTTTTTTTESTVTPDFFEEIFGGFTFEDTPEESKDNASTAKLEEQETINQEQFVKADDDIEDFFEAFDDKDRHPDGIFEDSYEYDDKEPTLDDHESSFESDDDRISSRDTNDEEAYDDYPERPYSLLEMMAME